MIPSPVQASQPSMCRFETAGWPDGARNRYPNAALMVRALSASPAGCPSVGTQDKIAQLKARREAGPSAITTTERDGPPHGSVGKRNQRRATLTRASLAKQRGGSGAQPEVTSISTARAAPSTPSQTPMKLPQTFADRRGISITNAGARHMTQASRRTGCRDEGSCVISGAGRRGGGPCRPNPAARRRPRPRLRLDARPGGAGYRCARTTHFKQ
jgi:hypothetical protein